MCFQGGKCDRPCVYQFQRWQPDNTEERQTTRREPGVEEQESVFQVFFGRKRFYDLSSHERPDACYCDLMGY